MSDLTLQTLIHSLIGETITGLKTAANSDPKLVAKELDRLLSAMPPEVSIELANATAARVDELLREFNDPETYSTAKILQFPKDQD